MQGSNNFIKVAVMVGLFVASLSTQVFAKPSLVAEMAELDQAIIPAASNSNEKKVEATKVAVSRLQSQWSLFLTSTKEAFPGDKDWLDGLMQVDKNIAEVAKASEEGNLHQVHEILEGVRNTFEVLREKRNIDYYLDGFSRYRRTLEKITTGLVGKKAADLTDADMALITSMVPDLKSTWASVQAAHLDAELFKFDATKVAEIKSAMDAVSKNIEKLETVVPGANRDEVFAALTVLKPSLKKAFLMFGKFQS